MNLHPPLTDGALDRMLAESAPQVEVDPSDVPRIVRRAGVAADVRHRKRLQGSLAAACALLGLAGTAAGAVGPTVFPHPAALRDGDRRTIAAVIRLHWQQPDGRQATCGYQPWYTGRMPPSVRSELTSYIDHHDWSDLNRRLVDDGSLTGYAAVPPQLRALVDASASTPLPGIRDVQVGRPSKTAPPDAAEEVAAAFQAAARSVHGAGGVHFGGLTSISCAAG